MQVKIDNRDTLKNAGYKYLFHDVNGYHVLYHVETGNIERYQSNKGYSGYTLRYKNTELEFCSSYNDVEKQKLFDTMRRIQYWGEQHPEFNTTMMNVYRKYIAR